MIGQRCPEELFRLTEVSLYRVGAMVRKTSKKQNAVRTLVEFWWSGTRPEQALTRVAIVEDEPDSYFFGLIAQ